MASAWTSKVQQKHKIVALAAGAIVLAAGIIIWQVMAGGFFASVAPEDGTVQNGATVVGDSSAHGGKAIQFNAPPQTPPPPPPPPPSTPPPSNNKNCASSPHVCGYPDETNTGWKHTGVTLTVINQDPYYITTEGAVIDSKDIRGCVVLLAKNVTIKRSKITCDLQNMIRVSDDGYKTEKAAGLLIEDVEFDGTNDASSSAIKASNYTVRRSHFHHIGSALRMYNNVLVEDSYVANIATESGVHNAGVPFDCGSHNILRHNTILMNSTSGHAVPVYNGNPCLVSDIVVDNNLLAGGNYTLWCGVPNVAPNLRVTNNRFSRMFDPKGGAIAATVNCGSTALWSNNVWDDTLATLSP